MIIVRNYGLLPPDNWGDDCHEQLFMMSKFWNQLVEIDHADRERYRAILTEDPEVATLEVRLFETSEQLLSLSTERKKLRSSARSKNVDDGLLVERIKILRETEKSIKAQLKLSRAAKREASKPALDALNEAHKATVKQARKTCGLFWSNYNAVLESYQAARTKAMKIGVDLRFRRFDGSGRFVNQVQGGIDVSEFMHGTYSMAGIDPELFPVLGRSGKDRPRLHITAFTGHDAEGKHFRRTLSFPVILHRPIPEEVNGYPVRIKTLTVSKKRVSAGHFDWSLTSSTNLKSVDSQVQPFMPERDDSESHLTSPQPGVNPDEVKIRSNSVPNKLSIVQNAFIYRLTITATTDGEAIANASPVAAGVNLGWKREGQALRVATIYDSNGDSEHFRLPATWTTAMDYAESLRGDIDEVTNLMFTALLAQNIESELLTKAKRPHPALINRFAREAEIRPMLQAHIITKELVIESIAMLPALNALPCYLAWSRYKEREFSGLRTRLLGQRKDLYRNIAATLASRYSVIAIDNADYAKMARLESRGGEENDLLKIARTNRFRVSPSELRLSIEQAIAKSGGVVERVGQQNECANCGRPDKQDTIIWKCGHCGAVYDQDENMAKLLIRGYLPEQSKGATG